MRVKLIAILFCLAVILGRVLHRMPDDACFIEAACTRGV